MLALSPERYSALLELPSATDKLQVRKWLDGLYIGTHPHWSLPPFSPESLRQLWLAFQAADDKDYSARQREALKDLTIRVRKSWHSRPRFPKSGDDASWATYFEAAQSPAFGDPSVTRDCIPSLIAELLGGGRTRRELLTRMLEEGLSPQSRPLKPFGAFVEDLRQATEHEYLCWTEITSHERLSKNFRRTKLGAIEVASKYFPPVTDASERPDMIYMIEGTDECYVVSREQATHRETAVYHHRVTARRLLDLRANDVRRRVDLATISFTQRVECLLASERTESRDSAKELLMSLRRSSGIAHDGPLVSAIHHFRDYPEYGIRDLCDAFDKRYSGGWIRNAIRNYRETLHSTLRRHLAEYLLHIGNRWANVTTRPSRPWIDYLVNAVGSSKGIRFETVRGLLVAEDRVVERLLAERLDQALAGRNYDTAYLEPLLTLAKGIRNNLTHSPAAAMNIDMDVRQYLLAILCHTYLVA